jgi:pyridoxamine 5'-phosphate oxidase
MSVKTNLADRAARDLAAMRVDYSQRSLSEQEVDADPVRQFKIWLDDAVAAEANEPNAMTLATSTRQGVPSARVVLLKGVDESGFCFYTNYLSSKAIELNENPRAALAFWWPELQRQVRIEGAVARTSAAESDAYFNSRPPAARIGSAASPQSQPIASRAVLEERERALLGRYPDGNIPRPDHWGGYRVRPDRVEFWQGRPSRLHDRIDYVRDGSRWRIRRLAP